jgi:hypothetical protein
MYVNFYDFILKNQKKLISSILLMQIKDDIKMILNVEFSMSFKFLINFKDIKLPGNTQCVY